MTTPPNGSDPYAYDDCTEPYDVLTLVLEECQVLTAHVLERLEDSRTHEPDDELYALTLIVKLLQEKQQLLRQHAAAVIEQVHAGE